MDPRSASLSAYHFGSGSGSSAGGVFGRYTALQSIRPVRTCIITTHALPPAGGRSLD